MYFFCCIKQETFEILELCLCLFQLIFSFRSFSLLAIYKTVSLSLKCKLEGGLPTFTRFYSILQYFSVYFSIFQHFSIFFGISPYYSKFSIFSSIKFFNIVQYLQYFSVYFRKDGVSQLQIGGRLAPFYRKRCQGKDCEALCFNLHNIIFTKNNGNFTKSSLYAQEGKVFHFFLNVNSFLNTRWVIPIVVVYLEMGLKFVFSS